MVNLSCMLLVKHYVNSVQHAIFLFLLLHQTKNSVIVARLTSDFFLFFFLFCVVLHSELHSSAQDEAIDVRIIVQSHNDSISQNSDDEISLGVRF